ncbi:MAG TPA: hypothetical protein PLN21_05830 [Gemmatales bacterium]|nr:hypothetical protein [Gemmatales bacterium]
MKRSYFLIVTAVLEAVTGLVLLIIPEALLKLLFGDRAATPVLIVYGRFYGAVLLAFSVACWFVRNQHGTTRLHGFTLAALLYDVVAAILLALLGLAYGMIGLLLWPAVAAHILLGGWGILCIRANNARPVRRS